MTGLLVQGEGAFPVISKALQYGGNLTIPHLTKDDQGSYECVASNPVTNVITSSLLIIECTIVYKINIIFLVISLKINLSYYHVKHEKYYICFTDNSVFPTVKEFSKSLHS